MTGVFCCIDKRVFFCTAHGMTVSDINVKIKRLKDLRDKGKKEKSVLVRTHKERLNETL